jgi:hypothetical protein
VQLGSEEPVRKRSFAIGLYGGLAERESIAAAYKQRRAARRLERIREHDRPQLTVRDDVHATKRILAADSWPANRGNRIASAATDSQSSTRRSDLDTSGLF